LNTHAPALVQAGHHAGTTGVAPPVKSNEERLLLISPELASVLATVITRLRARHGGAVALVTRYDGHERVTGPALPHLFQRVRGGRPQIISATTARRLINMVLAATALRDAANQPLSYTPHDFPGCSPPKP
jgi:hypothetical protein